MVLLISEPEWGILQCLYRTWWGMTIILVEYPFKVMRFGVFALVDLVQIFIIEMVNFIQLLFRG